MGQVTLELLTEQLALADQLLDQGENLFEPQDLPGRYGRVIKAIDHLLVAIGSQAVLGGGWAVWRHGFVGRVTQDIDVVLPADRVEEFLRVGSVSGFDLLPQQAGLWPRLKHRDTGVRVDVMPQGGRPGVSLSPDRRPSHIPAPWVPEVRDCVI